VTTRENSRRKVKEVSRKDQWHTNCLSFIQIYVITFKLCSFRNDNSIIKHFFKAFHGIEFSSRSEFSFMSSNTFIMVVARWYLLNVWSKIRWWGVGWGAFVLSRTPRDTIYPYTYKHTLYIYTYTLWKLENNKFIPVVTIQLPCVNLWYNSYSARHSFKNMSFSDKGFESYSPKFRTVPDK
jgi:hypothetical protein